MQQSETILTNELKLHDHEGRKASITFGDTNINDGYSFLKINYVADDKMCTFYQDKEVFNIVAKKEFLFNGRKIWHEMNDGPSSGMNADMLDGYHATEFKDRYGHHHFAHAFAPKNNEKQFIKIASFTPRRVGNAPDFNQSGEAPFQGIFADNIIKRLNAEKTFEAFIDDTPQKLGPVGFNPYNHTDMASEGVYNATLRASVSLLRKRPPAAESIMRQADGSPIQINEEEQASTRSSFPNLRKDSDAYDYHHNPAHLAVLNGLSLRGCPNINLSKMNTYKESSSTWIGNPLRNYSVSSKYKRGDSFPYPNGRARSYYSKGGSKTLTSALGILNFNMATQFAVTTHNQVIVVGNDLCAGRWVFVIDPSGYQWDHDWHFVNHDYVGEDVYFYIRFPYHNTALRQGISQLVVDIMNEYIQKMDLLPATTYNYTYHPVDYINVIFVDEKTPAADYNFNSNKTAQANPSNMYVNRFFADDAPFLPLYREFADKPPGVWYDGYNGGYGERDDYPEIGPATTSPTPDPEPAPPTPAPEVVPPTPAPEVETPAPTPPAELGLRPHDPLHDPMEATGPVTQERSGEYPWMAPTSVDIHIGLFDSPNAPESEHPLETLHKYFYVSLHDNALPYLTEQDAVDHEYFNGSYQMSVPVTRSMGVPEYFRGMGTALNNVEAICNHLSSCGCHKLTEDESEFFSFSMVRSFNDLGGTVTYGKASCNYLYSLGSTVFQPVLKINTYRDLVTNKLIMYNVMTVLSEYHICERVMDTSDYVAPPSLAKDYPPREFPPIADEGFGYQKEIDAFRLYHMDSYTDDLDGVKIHTHHFDLYMAVEPTRTEFRVQPYMSSSCLLYNYQEPQLESSLPNRPFLKPKSAYDERYSHVEHRHENYEKEIENIHVEVSEIWETLDKFVQIDQGERNKNKFMVTNEKGHVVAMNDDLERHKDDRRKGKLVLVTDEDKCIVESGVAITELNQLSGINGNIQKRFEHFADRIDYLLSHFHEIYSSFNDTNQNIYANAQHISHLYGEVDYISRHICGIYNDLKTLYQARIDLWTHIDKLWDHVGRIYYNIEKIWEEIKAIWDEIAKIWDEIEKLWEEIEKIWEEIEKIKEEIEEIWKAIEKLDKRIEDIEEKIVQIEKDIKDIKDSVSNLVTQLGDTNKLVCALYDAIKDNYKEYDSMWSHISKLWDHIAHIYPTLDSLDAEVGAHFLKRTGDTMWGDLIVIPTNCNFYHPVGANAPDEGKGVHVINGSGANKSDYEHARLFVRKQMRGTNKGNYYIGMCENKEFTDFGNIWPIWTYEYDYGRNSAGTARSKLFHLHKEAFLTKLAKVHIRGDIPADNNPTPGDIWIKNGISNSDLVEQAVEKGLQSGGSGTDDVG